MTVLHLDWETKSTADLKAVGLANYSVDGSTDIWCAGWAFDDEEPQIWTPPQPCPPRIVAHILAGGVLVGHNVAFEIAIWHAIATPRYGWPALKRAQTRDTMCMAYAMSLPGSLEKAAAAVGIAEQKDLTGGRLMMQMAKPRSESPLVWWDEPAKLATLHDYCRQDVRVERALDKRLMPLSPAEQEIWLLDQKINNRGVYVDVPAVKSALAIVEAEQARLDKEMKHVTDGAVGFCTETARIAKFCGLASVAKADVLDALELDALEPTQRAALLLRQEAGKSSTAKLRAMLAAVSRDGRLRGMFQYHGAGTGRWAGRRVQLQNLPRWPKWFDAADADEILTVLHTCKDPRLAADWIRLFHDNPLDILSYLLRPMLTAAPGHDLLAADFANIESRALAWLAGEEQKLDVFRAYDAGTGPDPYLVAAAGIYGLPIEECGKHRQIGKVAELACGYQGGVGAFQRMAKTYLVKVADEVAERAKEGWRAVHPRIVQYWYDLETAALDAVLQPGRATSAGAGARAVKFKVKGSFLWCLLPSGRTLCYPYPKVKPITTPWGQEKDQVHYMTVDGLSNKWVETHTYGGKLSENVTQAICRDLLASAMLRCEAEGYPVVLHVHDEVVSEVPRGSGSLEEFERICSLAPDWAAGLPVVAKGWRSPRYRKE